MGWRGGGRGRRGPWPGNGPFNYLPPWQRPGWLFGYGRGLGYGRGIGYGRGYIPSYGYNPYVCRRYPWLSRWWWANPRIGGYGTPLDTGYKPYRYYRYGTYGQTPINIISERRY